MLSRILIISLNYLFFLQITTFKSLAIIKRTCPLSSAGLWWLLYFMRSNDGDEMMTGTESKSSKALLDCYQFQLKSPSSDDPKITKKHILNKKSKQNIWKHNKTNHHLNIFFRYLFLLCLPPQRDNNHFLFVWKK